MLRLPLGTQALVGKVWWMVPMVAVIFVFGLLLALGQSSALAPFVYTIF